MSVRPSAWNSSAPTGRGFFLKEIWHWRIFLKSVYKIHVSFKSDRNNRRLIWTRVYIYDNISLNSSYNEKYFRQNLYRKSKHILCSIIVSSLNPAVCDIMRQKSGTARQDTDDNAMRCMRFACCVAKATNTHWEYVMRVLMALLQQEWFRESAWTYVAC